jgi:hypothetical protein
MATDERDAVDPIVGELRTYEPPPGFDAHAALTAGRRLTRRRRLMAITAVVALGATAGVSATVLSHGPVVPPAGIAEPLEVEVGPWPATPAGLDCEATEVELPAGRVSAELFGIDPDGRYMVGDATGPDGTGPVLWRDGIPEPLDGITQWIAVNRSGVVVGVDAPNGDGRPRHAYVLRDGAVHRLAVPEGYSAAVPTVITDDGDIFGTLLRGEAEFGDGPSRFGYNFHSAGTTRDLDLVYWPAGSVDSPRVITEPGQAQAIGVAGSGLLFAGVSTGDPGPMPYAWSNRLKGGPFPLPVGWDGLRLAYVRGDFLYGLRPHPSAGQSSGTGTERLQWRRPSQLVRWNIRTNRVETFADPVMSIDAANAAGWVVVQAEERLDPGALIVAPDGAVRAWSGGFVQWIAPDGRTFIGIGTHVLRPTKWTCR